jgi:hypothetical protein
MVEPRSEGTAMEDESHYKCAYKGEGGEVVGA